MRECQTNSIYNGNIHNPFEDKVNPSTIAVFGTKKNVFVQYVHDKQILGNSN